MPAPLTRIINVHVDGSTARRIDRHVAEVGGTLSDFARACLTAAVHEGGTAKPPVRPSELSAAIAALGQVASDLRRLGNLYAYALKAGRTVAAEEDEARLRTLAALQRAAERVLRS